MSIEEIINPTEEQLEIINSQLRDYNQSANPVFWDQINNEENRALPFKIFSFDNNNNITGGLFGKIRFKWLKVDIMAVNKDLRGQGIGSALLDYAEKVAKERGCQYIYLDTMEYQAVEFYKSNNYKVVGTIEDWDSHGSSKYFFVKRL